MTLFAADAPADAYNPRKRVRASKTVAQPPQEPFATPTPAVAPVAVAVSRKRTKREAANDVEEVQSSTVARGSSRGKRERTAKDDTSVHMRHKTRQRVEEYVFADSNDYSVSDDEVPEPVRSVNSASKSSLSTRKTALTTTATTTTITSSTTTSPSTSASTPSTVPAAVKSVSSVAPHSSQLNHAPRSSGSVTTTDLAVHSTQRRDRHAIEFEQATPQHYVQHTAEIGSLSDSPAPTPVYSAPARMEHQLPPLPIRHNGVHQSAGSHDQSHLYQQEQRSQQQSPASTSTDYTIQQPHQYGPYTRAGPSPASQAHMRTARSQYEEEQRACDFMPIQHHGGAHLYQQEQPRNVHQHARQHEYQEPFQQRLGARTSAERSLYEEDTPQFYSQQQQWSPSPSYLPTAEHALPPSARFPSHHTLDARALGSVYPPHVVPHVQHQYTQYNSAPMQSMPLGSYSVPNFHAPIAPYAPYYSVPPVPVHALQPAQVAMYPHMPQPYYQQVREYRPQHSRVRNRQPQQQHHYHHQRNSQHGDVSVISTDRARLLIEQLKSRRLQDQADQQLLDRELSGKR